MKLSIVTMVVASTFLAMSAQASDAKLTDMTCAQLRDKFEATDEAKARFSQLQGSCDGVYDIKGALYARVSATYQGKKDGKTLIYLPATDKTIEVTPKPDARVMVNGRAEKVSSLKKGDQLHIYLSVDKFAKEKTVEEVAFATETAAPEAISPAPAAEAAALPKTGSPLPLLALLSAGLIAVGGFVRRSVTKA